MKINDRTHTFTFLWRAVQSAQGAPQGAQQTGQGGTKKQRKDAAWHQVLQQDSAFVDSILTESEQADFDRQTKE